MTDLRKKPLKPWLASIVLTNLVKENNLVKDILLECIVQDNVDLISQLGYTLVTAGGEVLDNSRSIIGVISVLSVLLYDHPASIQVFLSETSHGQFVFFFIFHDMI